MWQPIEGSNPSLSATALVAMVTSIAIVPIDGREGPPTRCGSRCGSPIGTDRVEPAPCYDPDAVLGGELAVPCTCNPLQQG